MDIRFIDHFNTQLVIPLIIAPSLRSTFYQSLQHVLTRLPPAVPSLVVAR
jgi:hypothetical protein